MKNYCSSVMVSMSNDVANDNDRFARCVAEAMGKMQKQDLIVEVQFSTASLGTHGVCYSALILGCKEV